MSASKEESRSLTSASTSLTIMPNLQDENHDAGTGWEGLDMPQSVLQDVDDPTKNATPTVRFNDLENSTLNFVKQEYTQSCTTSARLLSKLKKDIDDASKKDYLLWQSDQPQSNAAQLVHPEISPRQGVHYIKQALAEANWTQTQTPTLQCKREL